jgi:hypothetical protein
MAEEQECLHCALMRALEAWGKDVAQVPVEDILADLGEMAGHVMACTDIPNNLRDVGPLLQLLVQSTTDSFHRYRQEVEKIEAGEIGESSAGHTLQ